MWKLLIAVTALLLAGCGTRDYYTPQNAPRILSQGLWDRATALPPRLEVYADDLVSCNASSPNQARRLQRRYGVPAAVAMRCSAGPYAGMYIGTRGYVDFSRISSMPCRVTPFSDRYDVRDPSLLCDRPGREWQHWREPRRQNRWRPREGWYN